MAVAHDDRVRFAMTDGGQRIGHPDQQALVLLVDFTSERIGERAQQTLARELTERAGVRLEQEPTDADAELRVEHPLPRIREEHLLDLLPHVLRARAAPGAVAPHPKREFEVAG